MWHELKIPDLNDRAVLVTGPPPVSARQWLGVLPRKARKGRCSLTKLRMCLRRGGACRHSPRWGEAILIQEHASKPGGRNAWSRLQPKSSGWTGSMANAGGMLGRVPTADSGRRPLCPCHGPQCPLGWLRQRRTFLSEAAAGLRHQHDLDCGTQWWRQWCNPLRCRHGRLDDYPRPRKGVRRRQMPAANAAVAPGIIFDTFHDR